jgi:BRCT domain type II-containing protein
MVTKTAQKQSTAQKQPITPKKKRKLVIASDDEFEDLDDALLDQIDLDIPVKLDPLKIKDSPRKKPKDDAPLKINHSTQNPTDDAPLKIKHSPQKPTDDAPLKIKHSPQIHDANSPDTAVEKSPAKPYAKFKSKHSIADLVPRDPPVGYPDCLKNLSFVFTGDLLSLSRSDAQDIVKRYGGYYACNLDVSSQPQAQKLPMLLLARNLAKKNLKRSPT